MHHLRKYARTLDTLREALVAGPLKKGLNFFCGFPKYIIKHTIIFQAALSSTAKKVPLFFYTLSIDSGGEGGDVEGEVIVRVNVLDENDNRPEFVEPEFHAAVQTSTEYGDSVTVLQV